MKIYLSYAKLNSKQTKSFYIKKRGVTIQLPTSQLDVNANTRSFIPNLIHSLDAANIHLLINDLDDTDKEINLYTIHDCFATTPNNMKIINDKLKSAFIKMYFDLNFINLMHDSFIYQINSITNIYTENIKENGILLEKNFIFSEDKNEKIYLPMKPKFINTDEVNEIFIKGLTKSLYFIN